MNRKTRFPGTVGTLKGSTRDPFVFIDGRGRRPDSISAGERLDIEKECKFKLISYHGELKTWLGDCAKVSEADKMRWFLRDFAEYVEKRFASEGQDDDH